MLKDDIEKYTNLTGEDGWHVPIMKVGAYLNGYNKGLDVLDKIRAEIEKIPSELTADGRRMIRKNRVMDILNKHIAERGTE